MSNDIGERFTDAITKVLKLLPRDGDCGDFPCPVCSVGTVRWVRIGRKKHLRIRCNTPECVLLIQ